MSQKKISEAKALAIQRMKELGFPVSEIAETLGVSRLTVHDHLHPDSYADRLKRTRDYNRRTTLVTGRIKEGLTVLRHLNKRPYPGVCEVCGIAREKGLHYYHWDGDNPSIGIWICARCHRLVELLVSLGSKRLGELLATYLNLKASITEAAHGAAKPLEGKKC